MPGPLTKVGIIGSHVSSSDGLSEIVTVPENPLRGVTVIVDMTDSLTLTAEGEVAFMSKSSGSMAESKVFDELSDPISPLTRDGEGANVRARNTRNAANFARDRSRERCFTDLVLKLDKMAGELSVKI